MKIIANEDAYADALSTAAIATIPFIIIGVEHSPAVLYAASSLGILLFCAFLIRFVYLLRTEDRKNPQWVSDLMSMLQLPYVGALSSLILINDRIDCSVGLWISLGMVVLSIAALPLLKEP